MYTSVKLWNRIKRESLAIKVYTNIQDDETSNKEENITSKFNDDVLVYHPQSMPNFSKHIFSSGVLHVPPISSNLILQPLIFGKG
jgi:hypothetical protein